MDYKNTYTWKEITETPFVFDRLREANEETVKNICKDIKQSGKTNFVAAGRGASNNALIYFKYVLEVYSDYTVGFSAPSIITLYKGRANYSNSIILGVSQSGKAEDVLEVIRKGNDDGA
ncbi:MAG: glutamine--fructose-6-phosphate aminotransferase, partial [Clostridia bacterium]|nr:glutamine--fructose-6-phosphate aminotransferase [Clostridia bacterium]